MHRGALFGPDAVSAFHSPPVAWCRLPVGGSASGIWNLESGIPQGIIPQFTSDESDLSDLSGKSDWSELFLENRVRFILVGVAGFGRHWLTDLHEAPMTELVAVVDVV